VPDRVLEGHRGPIAALAVSPDGSSIASASWDRTVRLWPLVGGAPRIFEGHEQNVNGVAFAPDGSALVSAGYDATVRIWPLAGTDSAIVAALSSPLNALTVAPDGEIAAAGANGTLYFISLAGELRGSLSAAATPVVALALSRDGAWLAAASIGGPVALVDRKARAIARELTGPGLPVWSAAFLPDGSSLLTGGADRMIRRWDRESGALLGTNPTSAADDPLAAFAGDPGARVFRACVACHTLSTEVGNRAGPTLHGVFGRHIASLPDYNYSEALRRLDIVWTPETVAKLFEIGPARYTPGTKMPEQRIGSAEDREALVKFLERVTQ
jgi:cytochrome c